MVETLVLAMASIFFILAPFAGAATVNVNCPADNFQTALDNANPGDTIVVSGTCTGNFLVRNDKSRVFIQSNGVTNDGCTAWATLFAGVNGSGTVLDIRGKGISVTCMNITNGDNGIVVQRGSNAVLDRNYVGFAKNGAGITVASSAFAAITNNQIFDNVAAGILVTENSSARIGWNNNINGSALNLIWGSDIGILVTGSSSAAIAGNDIFENTRAGIAVWRGAHADVSDNRIDENGDGISVSENSVVYLAGGAGIFAFSNYTDTNNTGFGIKCTSGGNVNGYLGILNGNMGQTSVDPSCSNNLTP